MNKNSLFSAQGSFLIGVDVQKANEFDLIDLIRAKKAAMGLLDAPRYDLNGDGVIDEKDLRLIKRKLLGFKE